MKFTDINAIFSQTVAQFLNAGYVLNTATMGGSQGDIAAIDLRKGERVIRVRMYKNFVAEGHLWGHYIGIMIGKCNDRKVIINDGYRGFGDTIWNNDLEVIEETRYWKMESRKEWYIEGEEGRAALIRNTSRCLSRLEHPGRTFYGMEKKVLNAVRRHLGNNKFPANRIMSVGKQWNSKEQRYIYYAELAGKVSTVQFN